MTSIRRYGAALLVLLCGLGVAIAQNSGNGRIEGRVTKEGEGVEA